MSDWMPGDVSNGYRLNDNGEWEPFWEVGSIHNRHLLTAGGWVPLTEKPQHAGPPWSVGDLVNGHVYDGQQWVSAASTVAATPPVGVVSTASGERPWINRNWGWVVGGVLALSALVGSVMPDEDAEDPSSPSDSATVAPSPTNDVDAKAECVRWNSGWHKAIEKKGAEDDPEQPGGIYESMENQPKGCDVSTDTFAYKLWHSTWKSDRAVKDWPTCESTLAVGATVTQAHADKGCARGFIKVEPILTECSDGSVLVALDDTSFGNNSSHVTAYGVVGKTFTLGESGLDIEADAGYADALSACG